MMVHENKSSQDGCRRSEVRDLKIKDTNDLIKKIENGELPDKIMLNPAVAKVEGVQNVKNVIKRWVIRIK